MDRSALLAFFLFVAAVWAIFATRPGPVPEHFRSGYEAWRQSIAERERGHVNFIEERQATK